MALTSAERGRYWQPKRQQWWWEAIVDWMILNPTGSHIECAAALGVHVQTIRTIVCSDLFKERLAERRAEVNQAVVERALNRAGRVAEKGLRVIEEHLDYETGELGGQKPARLKTSLQTLTEVTQKSMAMLGYGGGPKTVVNNTQVVQVGASASAIEEARARIRAQQGEGETTKTLEHDPFEHLREPADDGQLPLFADAIPEQVPASPDLSESEPLGLETLVPRGSGSTLHVDPLRDLVAAFEVEVEPEVVLVAGGGAMTPVGDGEEG